MSDNFGIIQPCTAICKNILYNAWRNCSHYTSNLSRILMLLVLHVQIVIIILSCYAIIPMPSNFTKTQKCGCTCHFYQLYLKHPIGIIHIEAPLHSLTAYCDVCLIPHFRSWSWRTKSSQEPQMIRNQDLIAMDHNILFWYGTGIYSRM